MSEEVVAEDVSEPCYRGFFPGDINDRNDSLEESPDDEWDDDEESERRLNEEQEEEEEEE